MTSVSVIRKGRLSYNTCSNSFLLSSERKDFTRTWTHRRTELDTHRTGAVKGSYDPEAAKEFKRRATAPNLPVCFLADTGFDKVGYYCFSCNF